MQSGDGGPLSLSEAQHSMLRQASQKKDAEAACRFDLLSSNGRLNMIEVCAPDDSNMSKASLALGMTVETLNRESG